MPRTFYMDLNRLDEDETPVTVAYGYEPGEPQSWEDPGSGPEIQIEDAWLKADEDNRDAPSIKWTDAEDEKWCAIICETHIDEPEDFEP